MKHDARYVLYEIVKKKIIAQKLPSDEYERRIKKLAEKLRI